MELYKEGNVTLHIKSESRRQKVIGGLFWFIFFKCKKVWHLILNTAVLLGFKNPSRAVFIVGSGRSGTDILLHCLNQSINVKAINETDRLAFDNWRLKENDEVLKVVSSSGAPLVVLKPIVETMRIKELLDMFPDSRGVFIYRNYQDAINSQIRFFREKNVHAVESWIKTDFKKHPLIPDELKLFIKDIWQRDQSNETASGIIWLVYNSSYFFLNLQEEARVILVDYESLVAEPENTLRDLCGFLGLKYKKSMKADIYSGSVSRNPPPSLSHDLQLKCHEIWHRLSEI